MSVKKVLKKKQKSNNEIFTIYVFRDIKPLNCEKEMSSLSKCR